MTSKIALRDAQLTDITAIAQLHARSWQQTYRGIYSDVFLDHDAEKDRLAVWQNRLTAPKTQQQVLVAEQGATLVGFACLLIDEEPQFGTLLDNLHIAAQWQGLGIGKQLLQACAGRVTTLSQIHKLYLWVYETNTRARKVYERLGAAHQETVNQPTASGTPAQACRYVWEDVGVLL